MSIIPFDNSYARLQDRFYTRLGPTAVADPHPIRVNRALAEHLGIDPDWLASPAGTQVVAGNDLPTFIDLSGNGITFTAGGLYGLYIHVENYPALKGDAGFMKLMDTLEGTENRILIARKKYNGAVKNYNTELKKVGGKVLDSVTGDVMFEPRTMYKAQAGAEVAPDLDI